jgi:hypothetical protein
LSRSRLLHAVINHKDRGQRLLFGVQHLADLVSQDFG